MITPRQQIPANESRIAHDSQSMQYATMHRKNIPSKKDRPVIVSMAALLLLSIASASAIAQPPDNDKISGATQAYEGDSFTLDTTEATTDDDDSQLNEYCGAPATDASVWFAYTANSDSSVIVDTSGSDYSTGISVGAGDPGDLYLQTCGPSTIAFGANAGETYYLFAFDYQGDGGGNGGQLNINFREALSPVIEDFTVNRFGQFSKNGIATISGSYTCSNGYGFSVYTDATQPVGKLILSGSGYFYDYGGTCDQQPHPWTLR